TPGIWSKSFRPDWADPTKSPVLTMVDLPSNGLTTAPWDPTAGTPEKDSTAGDKDGPGSDRFRFADDTFIPPHGFLVVSNFPDTVIPPNPADPDTAQYVPGT